MVPCGTPPDNQMSSVKPYVCNGEGEELKRCYTVTKKLKKYIRRYTSISAVIDILKRKELPLLNPQTWDDRNDRHFMSLYKEQLGLGGLYGLCAAACSETYHHWRVFTGTNDGACIEIKRQPLEKELTDIEGVRFGDVDYLLLEDVERLTESDFTRLPFVKRFGFSAEKEYRITAETTEAQRPAISIDFPVRFINKIYLNPWLPEPIARSVTATLKGFPDCENLKVQRSHLIDSERWKKAGDQVVGKKQPPTVKLSKSK